MSIQLLNGFVNEPLDRVLEDLLCRFVINCPPEDLSSIERVYFQIEEAHWFYLDFILPENPKLPSMKMKTFSIEILKKCPLLWKWGDPEVAINTFNNYKRRIPVRGACLFNAACDKVLLVKGTESRSWSFPRGKIGKDETDTECCLREIKEEIGYDASVQMREDSYIERTIQGKNYKIYMLKDIPDDVQFVPEARNEISEIKWFDFKKLVKTCHTSPKGFFLVGNMLQQMIQYNRKQRGVVSDEELKRKAERKLKVLLGVGEPAKADAGRELLSMMRGTSQAEHQGVYPGMIPTPTFMGGPSEAQMHPGHFVQPGTHPLSGQVPQLHVQGPPDQPLPHQSHSRELLNLLSAPKPPQSSHKPNELLALLHAKPRASAPSNELLDLLTKPKHASAPPPLERKGSVLAQALEQARHSVHAPVDLSDNEYDDYEDFEDVEAFGAYPAVSFDHFEIHSDNELYQSDEEIEDEEEDEVGEEEEALVVVAPPILTDNRYASYTSPPPPRKFTLLKRGEDIDNVLNAKSSAAPGTNPLMELLHAKSQYAQPQPNPSKPSEPFNPPSSSNPSSVSNPSNPSTPQGTNLMHLLKSPQTPSAAMGPTDLLSLLTGPRKTGEALAGDESGGMGNESHSQVPTLLPSRSQPNDLLSLLHGVNSLASIERKGLLNASGPTPSAQNMTLNNIGLPSGYQTGPVDEFIQQHARVGSAVTPSTTLAASPPPFQDPAIAFISASPVQPKGSIASPLSVPGTNPLLALLKQGSQLRPVPISLDALEASLTLNPPPVAPTESSTPQETRRDPRNGHAASLLDLLKGRSL